MYLHNAELLIRTEYHSLQCLHGLDYVLIRLWALAKINKNFNLIELHTNLVQTVNEWPSHPFAYDYTALS